MMDLNWNCKYIYDKDDKTYCEIRIAVEEDDQEFLDMIPKIDLEYWKKECRDYPNPKDPGQMPPRHELLDTCTFKIRVE